MTRKYTTGIWDRGDKRIRVYVYGKCTRRDEGMVGFDVKIRPESLGEPEKGYTAVVNGLHMYADEED